MVASHDSVEASGSAPSLTPQGASPPVSNKRPRPVLSCLECRRKKLKCDRLLPCNQCNKSGQSAQCAYYNRRESQAQALLSEESESEIRPRKKSRDHNNLVVSQPSRNHVPNRMPNVPVQIMAKNGVIEDLQARVAKLEGLLSSQTHLPQIRSSEQTSNMYNHVVNTGWALGSHQRGILSLKGTRTRYFGPSHKLALLNRFEDASDFCKRGFPGLSSMMDEFRRYQKVISKKLKMAAPVLDPLSSSAAFAKLQEIIPSRGLCDRLVSSYIYNGEKAIRILHIPSFLRECQQFWENPESLAASNPCFVPQLVAVMLIGSCWDDSEYFPAKLAEHGLSRPGVCKILALWLEGLNWKKRTEIGTLRTQALLLIANQLCLAIPLETVWSNSGGLVRSAMTMGLHRDPSEFPDISIFEGEQRRRLWMSIVELDLQGSLISGCPGMVREGDYTCSAPANVDDLQLFEEMIDFPPSKPLEEWTDSTCQVILARSLSLRLQAMSLTSNINTRPDYRAFLEMGGKIEAYIRNLPSNIRFDYASMSGSEGPGRLVGRLLLDMFLRRLLVCIYRPFVLNSLKDETFLEGRRACIRTALIILCRQDSVDPNVADLNVINSEKYWDVYNLLLRTDIVQAALTICLEIKAMGEASHDVPEELPSSHSVWQNSPSLTWTKASLTRAVENTLNSLLRRIGETGTDIRDPLALSMVLQAARTSGPQDVTDRLIRVGANTVIKACRQYFLDENNNVTSLAKPINVPLVPGALSTPPGGIEDTGELAFDSRTMPSFESADFPVTLDVDVEGLEFNLDIDWDWGEPWS